MAIAIQDAISVTTEVLASGDKVTTASFAVSATDANTLLLVAGFVDSAQDCNSTLASDLDTLTQIGSEITGSSTNQAGVLYVKQNPTASTHTITLTSSGAINGNTNWIMAICLSGVSSYGTVQQAGGSVASLSLSDTSAGDSDWIIDLANVNGNPTVTVGADQTQRYNTNSGGSGGAVGLCSTQLGSVSGDAMTWSWSGNQRTAHFALKLVASSTTVNMLAALGVG